VVDELLAAQPLKTADGQQSLSSLSEVSRYIDDNLTPVSQPITGWSASLTTEFDADVVTATNLIGVVEGEGELADETIVIGGHYDHIGYGGFGSRAPNRKGEIHNGADDNATGTAAVLEIARRIAGGPATRRRILFICFSAEEKGLLGSRYYISHPVIPLEKTVAMLNYDMIGTLRNNLVEVNGVGTAAEFYSIVKQADEASPLDIKVVDSPFAGSDHLPFFQKQIPVMFCFTGITDRYHTPEDDFEQINVEGVVSIIDYSEHLLRSIDALAQAPHFQSVSRRSRTRKIPVLGVHPNLSDETDLKGVLVKGVSPDSGAAAAGIQVADVITAINDDVIESHLDLIESLKKQSAGTVVRVRLTRNSQELLLDVQLGSP
jgi:Iap family predicted aminopeptidase